MDDRILAAAQTIAQARRNRSSLKALPPDLAPSDEVEGYRVQRAVHDLLLPHTGPLVGYKIGCTSAVMQRYLNIPHPCGGGVFARGVHESGVALQSGDFVRVGGRMRDRGAAWPRPRRVGGAVHGGHCH